MQALELKVPPPVLMLLFAVTMWLLSMSAPSLTLALPWRIPVALILWSAGIAIALAALFDFLRAKTTVNPPGPEAAAALVPSGIYRYSPNPMFLGFLLAPLG